MDTRPVSERAGGPGHDTGQVAAVALAALLDVETMSLRTQRIWRGLLVAAQEDRLRRVAVGIAIHDTPSGQPERVCTLVAKGQLAGWLTLDAERYRRTPAGDAALDELSRRIDEASGVTTTSRSA